MLGALSPPVAACGTGVQFLQTSPPTHSGGLEAWKLGLDWCVWRLGGRGERHHLFRELGEAADVRLHRVARDGLAEAVVQHRARVVDEVANEELGHITTGILEHRLVLAVVRAGRHRHRAASSGERAIFKEDRTAHASVQA